MYVCVFCSSASAAQERFGDVATEVGAALVARGHHLVYGGTNVGMMGGLATAVRTAGGRVVGILPKLLVERGLADEACDELIVSDGMADRKTAMLQRADAFLAIPGGLGTLDELFEMITLKQLGYHTKPIAVYGPDGFWDPLGQVFSQLHDLGMSLPPDELALTTGDLGTALDHLEAGGAAPTTPWRA